MELIHIPVSVKAPGRLAAPGVERIGHETFELADGSFREYAFGVVQIEFMGAITGGRVLFAPDGTEHLLGVTPLESAGFTIDLTRQALRKLPAIRL